MGSWYHQIQTIQTVQNKQKWFKCPLFFSRVYMEVIDVVTMQLGRLSLLEWNTETINGSDNFQNV